MKTYETIRGGDPTESVPAAREFERSLSRSQQRVTWTLYVLILVCLGFGLFVWIVLLTPIR